MTNRRLLFLPFLCLFLLFASSARPFRATVTTATAPPKLVPLYTEESREAFLAQLRRREIKEAEFNKVAAHLHLRLKDGRYMLVAYPGKEEPKLQRILLEAGVPVTIEYTPLKHSPVHHTLRYVAAGLVGFLLVVLIALLLWRRRRLAAGRPSAP